MIKRFQEYVEEGIVKRVSLDRERAKNLISDSERKLRVLDRQIKALGIDNDLSNEYVLTCYDALMLIIRAKMLSEGYNSSGLRAHEAEISYMQNIKFDMQEIEFADKMRFYRNGMLYYGTSLDEEYAQKVIEFTKKNCEKIKQMIKL